MRGHFGMNNKENNSVKCPVCKKKDSKILYTVNSETAPAHFLLGSRNESKYMRLRFAIENIWAKNTCSFYQCNYCDFCFSFPFVAGNTKYYSTLYDNENKYPNWKWEFEITLLEIHKLVHDRQIKKKFNFLELGAGNGEFIRRIISDFSKEPKITCTEFSESAINSISDLDIDCFSKDVRDFDVKIYKNHFDVICMFQVLEHLDKLDELFVHLNHISNQKCNLFIGVPNFEHRAFFDKYGFIEDIPPHHISRWNEKNLRIIGDRFGWELVCYRKEPLDKNKIINKFRNVILENRKFTHRINNKLIRNIIIKFDKVLSYIKLFFYLPKLKTQIKNDLGLVQWAHLRKK